MKYALISDIHANLPALEAVLADIDGRTDVDATYHLGDLVGYCPWPNEVVDLLRSRAISGIAGNYDSTTGTDYKHCGCRYENPRQEELSHLSYAWTRAHVSPQTKRYLAGLPFRLDVWPKGGHISGSPKIVLVHGAPILNTLYWTEDRPDSFCLQMAGMVGAKAGDVLTFGHTHRPWYREVEGIHFVNTGSVGKPKDGHWRAGYVLLDYGDVPAVEFIRVDYDIERTMNAIRESELPDQFAEDLGTGGAPGSPLEFRATENKAP